MQKTQNLQDLFLNQARKERLAVTMFLMNGFQLRGVIRGFDGFTVILDSDGKQQMIYKHAISTVVPVRPVALDGDGERHECSVPFTVLGPEGDEARDIRFAPLELVPDRPDSAPGASTAPRASSPSRPPRRRRA